MIFISCRIYLIALRIAVNTRLLLAHRMEGIARYIYETTKRMVLAHPEDEFHFFFDRPYDSKFVFADNVIPHVISPPARHPILWYLWFELAVPKKLKEIKADVFLSGDMYLSLRAKVPTVMVSHDLGYEHYPSHLRWSHKKYMLHYSPQYHKKAAHLIAVSNATKADIIKTYQLSTDRITVAHNAAPHGFIPIPREKKEKIRTQFSDGNPYFIYVGSLHPRKNISNLLLAFEQFKSTNKLPHKLIIFGRIAFKTNKVFSTLSNLQFKKDVLFLSDDDCSVSKLMAAAEALCYVSLYEGFGIPILEAFSCKVPIITSNVSSMPEVAGEAALLVDPKDINDISTAMLKITSNDVLRAKLIDLGYKQKEMFSWDISAETIYESISTLTKKGSYGIRS